MKRKKSRNKMLYVNLLSGFIFPCFMSSNQGSAAFAGKGQIANTKGVDTRVFVSAEWAWRFQKNLIYRVGREPGSARRLQFAGPRSHNAGPLVIHVAFS